MNKIFIAICFVFIVQTSFADKVKSALKYLHKGDYEKVVQLLDKSMENSGNNPGAHYVYSLLYSTDKYEQFDLPLSYDYILKAIVQLSASNDDDKKLFTRQGFSRDSLNDQKDHIELLAYKHIATKPTITACNDYIDLYKESVYMPDVIYKRDSTAFEKAKAKGSWQSYKVYCEQYKESAFYELAETEYYQLHYADYFRNPELVAYKSYAEDFKNSPYRESVLKEIFKLSCLDGLPKSYLDFIHLYPESEFSTHVASLLRALDASFYQNTYFNSSPQLFSEKDADFVPGLFYFLEKGKREGLGLMSTDGTFSIKARFDGIPREYKTSLSKAPVVIGFSRGNLMVKSLVGDTVFYGDMSSCNYIPGGFLELNGYDNDLLISYLGDTVLSGSFDEIETIDKRFFIVERNDHVGLYSFTGVELIPAIYDEIEKQGNNWVLFTENDSRLIKEEHILNLEHDIHANDHVYEEVEMLGDSSFLVFEGDLEGSIDDELKPIILPGNHRLTPFPGGVVIKEKKQARVVYKNNETDQRSEDIKLYNNRWLVFKGEKFAIKDLQNPTQILLDYDTIISISRHYLFLKKEEKKHILCTRTSKLLNLKKGESFYPVSGLGADDKAFICVSADDEHTLYDKTGKLMLKTTYQNPVPIDSSLFLVEKKKSKGIIDSENNIILDFKYDGMAYMSDKAILTTSKGELRLFVKKTRQLSLHTFESRPSFIAKDLYSVTVGGKIGFTLSNGELWLTPRFDQVQPWNSGKVLVKENDQWGIFDIQRKKFILDKIISFDFISDVGEKKIIRFFTSQGVGIMDSKKGIVLQAVYDDITNLGDKHAPFYLAYTEDNDLFNVNWISEKGKIIFSEKYNERDFDRLYGSE